jgi:hypothetical protein
MTNAWRIIAVGCAVQVVMSVVWPSAQSMQLPSLMQAASSAQHDISRHGSQGSANGPPVQSAPPEPVPPLPPGPVATLVLTVDAWALDDAVDASPPIPVDVVVALLPPQAPEAMARAVSPPEKRIHG